MENVKKVSGILADKLTDYWLRRFGLVGFIKKECFDIF